MKREDWVKAEGKVTVQMLDWLESIE